MTDNEYLAAHAHLSDETIKKDIKDTQAEITSRLTQRANTFGNDRMTNMRRRALSAQIDERKKFVADLQRLLKLRHPE